MIGVGLVWWDDDGLEVGGAAGDLAFVAAAACLAAADCSNNNNPLSGMSAKQVTAKAIADLKSAPNFAMTGSAVSGGHTFSLDLGFKGQECAGTIGEGPAGLLHTSLAKLRGAGPVIGISRSQWKLDLAKSHYGADYVFAGTPNEEIMKLTDGRGADLVIESVGSASTFNMATELVRPAGTILAFGITPPTISEFRSYALYYKDITIVGSRAMQPIDWPTSIDLAKDGKIDLATMITHHLPLTDLVHAFELQGDSSKRALRLVIEI